MKIAPAFLWMGIVLLFQTGAAGRLYAEEAKTATPMQNIRLKDAIPAVEDVGQQQALRQFQEQCDAAAEVYVTAYEAYFEIIVVHPVFTDTAGNVFTGGAEQFLLDKKTGATSMGWHEHPMPLPAGETGEPP